MSVELRPGSKYYHYHYHYHYHAKIGGKRYRGSTGCETKADALAFEVKVRAAIMAGTFSGMRILL